MINRDNEYPHLRKRFFSQDIKSVVKDKSFFSSLFNDLKEEFKRDFKVNTVDLVTGGPPCQGFSGIGIRRSYSVEKKQLPSNHLYQDMAFFVHKVQPKIFLFENVEGLLRSRWTKDGIKGEIFKDVLGTFQSLKGYSVKFKLIHAKDYGVPQYRPRILIIGIKNKLVKKRTSSLDALEAGFLPKTTNDFPDIVISNSYLIGDSDSDILAGQAMNLRTVKVNEKYTLAKWTQELLTFL